jgi:hypothetical protein
VSKKSTGFSSGAFALRLLSMGALVSLGFYLGSLLGDNLEYPSLAAPALMVVLGLAWLSHRRIYAIPIDKGDLFVKAVLLSMVLRLGVYASLALAMLWLAPELATFNILYFLALYLGVTTLDFWAVYQRNKSS